MILCERYGCDGRFYPVAEYRDRRSGEFIQSRPLLGVDDEMSAQDEAPPEQVVHIALMACDICRPAMAEEGCEDCGDDREKAAQPVYDERQPFRPWWVDG